MSNHESKQNNPRISSQITISSVFPVTSKSLRSPLSAAPHLPPWPGVPQQPERSQRPCSLHRSQATLRGTGSSFASPRDTATTPWKPCQNSEVPQAIGIFISRFLSRLTQISFSFCSPRSDTLCQQRAATCFSKFCLLFHFCLPFAHTIARESSPVLQGVSSLFMAARRGTVEDREGGEAEAAAQISCNIW